MTDAESRQYGSAALRKFFEFVSSRTIANGGQFEVRELLSTSERVPAEITMLKAKQIIQVENAHTALYSAAAKLKKCKEITTPQDRIIVKLGASNQPVVDLMDAKDRAFQSTISINHSISDQLETLMKQVGISNFCLYFVVPPSRFDIFGVAMSSLKHWKEKGVRCFVLKWAPPSEK